MKVNDIVSRQKHNNDIMFRVVTVHDDDTATLRGISVRLKVRAKLSGLNRVNINELDQEATSFRDDTQTKINKILKERNNIKESIGVKILHIDADESYMNMCLNGYKQLGIDAIGVCCEEQDQPIKVKDLLIKHKPDVLVLTGHDGLKKNSDIYNINNYANSQYYVQATLNAREVIKSKDELIIIAGACQSYFEKLIESGSNFSSSPKRVVINALDPMFVADEIVYTKIQDVLEGNKINKNTVSGIDGIGGISTRGLLRNLTP